MSFQGFGPKALPFLKALGFHQTKEWFEANRATYESDLKTPLGDLVEDLIHGAPHRRLASRRALAMSKRTPRSGTIQSNTPSPDVGGLRRIEVP